MSANSECFRVSAVIAPNYRISETPFITDCKSNKKPHPQPKPTLNNTNHKQREPHQQKDQMLTTPHKQEKEKPNQKTPPRKQKRTTKRLEEPPKKRDRKWINDTPTETSHPKNYLRKHEKIKVSTKGGKDN